MWIQYYQNIVLLRCIFPKSAHIVSAASTAFLMTYVDINQT